MSAALKNVRDTGAVGDGRADDRAAVQKAIDTGGAYFPPGTYRCTGALKVDAGDALYVDHGAKLVKDFAASGAVKNAFIQNRTWGNSGPSGVVKVHDVTIGGPGTITAASKAQTGNIISLFGDRIILRDFTTDVWEGGRHTVLAGDHCRAYNLMLYGGTGSTGNGGIRFQGGKGFIAEGCYCESGDDVYQFVPAGASADPTYGMDIEDSVYIGCTGSSSHAKLMVIGLQEGGSSGAPDGVVTMTSSVRGSGFIGCKAPDGAAITSRIQNISSSGVIDNCFMTDCGAVGLDTTTGGVELLLNAWEDTGGIHNMQVVGLDMRRPLRQPVAIQRGCTDVLFDRCYFRRGVEVDGKAVLELTGTRTTLRNCIVDGANSTAPVILVKAPESGGGPAPSKTVIDGTKIIGINGTGIELKAGAGAWLNGNTFAGKGTTVKFTGATKTRLTDNDYGGLTRPSVPSGTLDRDNV